jgi:hypothetical protein
MLSAPTSPSLSQFAVNSRECNHTEAPPSLNSLAVYGDDDAAASITCEVSAITSLAKMASSNLGNKYVSFFVDGDWTAPQFFFRWDRNGYNHTERYTLPSKPMMVRISIDDSAQAWGFWRLTMQCDRCAQVRACMWPLSLPVSHPLCPTVSPSPSLTSRANAVGVARYRGGEAVCMRQPLLPEL